MYLDVLRGGGPQTHPPGQGGLPAKGFPVHKIAPAANGLANEQTHDPQIRKGPKGQFLLFTVDQQHKEAHNDRPVNGKASVPNGYHFSPIKAAVRIAVEIQVEQNIVQSCANDAKGDLPDNHVIDIVLGKAIVLGPPAAKQHRQDQAQGNDDTIPVDAIADINGHRRRVKLPVPKQARKTNGHIASCVHTKGSSSGKFFVLQGRCAPSSVPSLAGQITERAACSSVISSRRKASTSALVTESKISGKR